MKPYLPRPPHWTNGQATAPRQKSEISGGVAQQQAETAIYRKVTGKRPNKKRRRPVLAW
jgi:hypothetical protein